MRIVRSRKYFAGFARLFTSACEIGSQESAHEVSIREVEVMNPCCSATCLLKRPLVVSPLRLVRATMHTVLRIVCGSLYAQEVLKVRTLRTDTVEYGIAIVTDFGKLSCRIR